jgi:basic membrane protein A
MKKKLALCLISLALGLLVSTTIVFAARQNHPEGATSQEISVNTTTRVGLIPDGTGITDNNFNWFSYQGLVRAESELGVTGTVYTPTNNTEYEAKLLECVGDGNELCIAVGFPLKDATISVATSNPMVKFAIVDVGSDTIPPNMRFILFRERQAGYLAGSLAGKMTTSDVIGAVAGMEIYPVVEFAEGYRNGAQCANADVEVLINYTGTFVDPDLGADVAQDMISQGADTIFAIGGSTGQGAVLTATQSGEWGIGVDTDWYITVYEEGSVDGSDKLLSSAMKRMDNAVFDTISDYISGTFTSGEVYYTLVDEGVGLAPYHETDPYVSQSVRDYIDFIEQGIINGTIDPHGSCSNYIYLPLLNK